MKRKVSLLIWISAIIIGFMCGGCGKSGAGFNGSSEFQDSSAEEQIDFSLEKDSPDQTSSIAENEIWTQKMFIQKAEDIVSGMSLEEKIGQVFFGRCPGGKKAVEDISIYHLGGYILFAEDFKGQTPESIKEKIYSYQEISNIPLLIGVDEEGGIVNRVSKYASFRETPFLSPQTLYEQGGYDRIRQDTLEKSDLLLNLGINVNLAPVCDVSMSSQDYMYSRSFGRSADETSEYVSTVVSAMEETGIGAVLKHFPGYGDNKDTHKGIAIDYRPYEAFAQSDFLPFISGMGAGNPAVLVSHNIVACMDDALPASLSSKVHQVLEQTLGNDCLTMTDDLDMNGITNYTDKKQSAILALQAGNNLLICSDYAAQISAVQSAIHAGALPESLIDDSVKRILIWKMSLGLFKKEE